MNITTKNLNFWALLGIVYFSYILEEKGENWNFKYPSEKSILDTINSLPRKIPKVIKMRYGLTGEKPMTLEQIGKKLKLGKERIRQIEAKGLRMLRHPIRKNLIYINK